MAKHPRQRRFLCGQLRHHRLVDVEAVVHEPSALVSGRHRAGSRLVSVVKALQLVPGGKRTG